MQNPLSDPQSHGPEGSVILTPGLPLTGHEALPILAPDCLSTLPFPWSPCPLPLSQPATILTLSDHRLSPSCLAPPYPLSLLPRENFLKLESDRVGLCPKPSKAPPPALSQASRPFHSEITLTSQVIGCVAPSASSCYRKEWDLPSQPCKASVIALL